MKCNVAKSLDLWTYKMCSWLCSLSYHPLIISGPVTKDSLNHVENGGHEIDVGHIVQEGARRKVILPFAKNMSIYQLIFAVFLLCLIKRNKKES